MLLEILRAQHVGFHSVVLSLTITLRTDSFFSTRLNILGLQEMKSLTGILTISATLHGYFVLCVSLKWHANDGSKKL